MLALKAIVVTLVLTTWMPVSAQVYKWVDSEGQTHFTQSPPPDHQANNNSSVVKVEAKSNRINSKNGHPFCGELKLPANENPLYLLGEVKSQKSNWRSQLENKHKEIERIRQQQMSRGGLTSTSSSRNYLKRMDEVKANIADLECGISWAGAKEIELQPEYEQFQQKYKAAVDGFEKYKNRCGPKPEITGYTTDPRAKEWARCQRAGGTSEHNRRLREVKKMKSLAGFLD